MEPPSVGTKAAPTAPPLLFLLTPSYGTSFLRNMVSRSTLKHRQPIGTAADMQSALRRGLMIWPCPRHGRCRARQVVSAALARSEILSQSWLCSERLFCQVAQSTTDPLVVSRNNCHPAVAVSVCHPAPLHELMQWCFCPASNWELLHLQLAGYCFFAGPAIVARPLHPRLHARRYHSYVPSAAHTWRRDRIRMCDRVALSRHCRRRAHWDTATCT